jgi:hypothetical protein
VFLEEPAAGLVECLMVSLGVAPKKAHSSLPSLPGKRETLPAHFEIAAGGSVYIQSPADMGVSVTDLRLMGDQWSFTGLTEIVTSPGADMSRTPSNLVLRKFV